MTRTVTAPIEMGLLLIYDAECRGIKTCHVRRATLILPKTRTNATREYKIKPLGVQPVLFLWLAADRAANSCRQTPRRADQIIHQLPRELPGD